MSLPSASMSLAKKSLRNCIKKKLSELPSAEIERQSRDVRSQLFDLPEFKEAARISVYLSMPTGEIATDEIVKQALAMGKKVFVPNIQTPAESTGTGKIIEMLALHSQHDLEALLVHRDGWGIPTLSKESLVGRENALGGFGPCKDIGSGNLDPFKGLDLILLPGLAFDQSKGRLGHGKGFYDRFLQRYWDVASRQCSATERPLLVGLALKQQLLPAESQIPMSTNDWSMDRVITCR